MVDLVALTAAYRRHLQQYDTWFAECMQRFSDRIACTAGCAACCRALFDISLLDAALLQEGFRHLSDVAQRQVVDRAQPILQRINGYWPEFAHPFTLNHRPEEQWEIPKEDDTPCPFLDMQNRCLVYAYRPATCRLHGLPNVDHCGGVFQREACTRNFPGGLSGRSTTLSALCSRAARIARDPGGHLHRGGSFH
jgi:Fe-S-cluster containining protein